MHTFGAGADLPFGIGGGAIHALANTTASGTTDNSNGLPPFYSLAFIMFTG